jgi:tetratricopeptide (TPR) repeat protein
LVLAIASTLWAEPPVKDVPKLRDLSVSYTNLADERWQAGDSIEARSLLEQAVRIDTELLNATPESDLGQRDLSVSTERLGDVLRQLNDLAGARKLYEQSRDLRQKLVNRQPKPDRQSRRDLSISLERLGVVRRQAGDLPAAEADLQAAYQLRTQIVDVDQTNATAKRELSVTIVLLGDVQMQSGKLDGARLRYEQALRLDRELWETSRTDVTATRDLSISHEKLGDVSLRLAETTNEREHAANAREHFERSVKLRDAVVAASGNSTAARQDLALALNRVGEASLKLEDLAAARQAFERALQVRESLAKTVAPSRTAQRDLIRSHEKVGRLCLQLEFTDRARENFDQALRLAESNRKESDDAESQADWAGVAGYLGAAEMQAEDFAAAARWFEKGSAVLAPLVTDGSSPSSLRYRDWLIRQREQLARCQQAERGLRELEFVVTLAKTQPKRAAELLRIRSRDQARRMVPSDSAEAIRKAIDPIAPSQHLSLARWLALAAGAVGGPPEKLNPPDVIERRKYVELAIELLSEIRKTPNGKDTLQRLADEGDFASLRSDPGFQILLKTAP